MTRERNRWRVWAREAAIAKGARRACDLCKRATMGAASVDIRPPWSTSNSKIRSLCSEHWKWLTTLIDDMEYRLDNYDQVIDRVQRKGLEKLNEEMDRPAVEGVG